ncbi:MAG: hypothetical protein J2P28_00095 [Actinobacteria bacterium]|nr:hypothetical protein [Actinomycetota bacterium]MBO0833901.1 hypothetical protein [Actinomycetota bacterium]
MTTYYRVVTDPLVAGLCLFGEPHDASGQLDARRFTHCEKFGQPLTPLRIPITVDGVQPEFGLGAFELPVVSPQLGKVLLAVAPGDVELIPAAAGQDPRSILNVLSCVDCIDEDRTVGDKWPADSPRAGRIGTYRTIVDLFLDASRITGQSVFRVRGWEVALVISEQVAQHLSEPQLRGIRLLQVT